MSISGEIVIECDNQDCHAEHRVAAYEAYAVPARLYFEDEGWTVVNGRHICPQCIAESTPEPMETRP
jgi:hypothetical protein